MIEKLAQDKSKRFTFFDKLKKFISFEPLKQQAPKNCGQIKNFIIYMPIFMIMLFSPTLYFAYSFGDGSHLKVTHGRLDYAVLGKPNANNFIVYPNDGSKPIGGYSSKPCGNFLKQTVLQYQGNPVTAWYQNNAIYQLTFESSNQLIIPECSIQNNKIIYVSIISKYVYYCLTIFILTLLYIYQMQKIVYKDDFDFKRKHEKIQMFKVFILYFVLSMLSAFYFGRNFTTLIELIFGSFK